MKKIDTIFMREGNPRRVINQIPEGCEWVFAGEGIATQKLDGTCCLIKDGVLYRRRRVKSGQEKPPSWIHHTLDPKKNSGHGWMYVDPENPENSMHIEALINTLSSGAKLPDGTYEMCGPRVRKNPEKLDKLTLIKHGETVCEPPVRTFGGIRRFLQGMDVEGLVFHHPDGRMAKIKKSDFGLPREPQVLLATEKLPPTEEYIEYGEAWEAITGQDGVEGEAAHVLLEEHVFTEPLFGGLPVATVLRRLASAATSRKATGKRNKR